jgi:precorrin-2/cobalt-factor-2 C20-methyltransferase
MVNPSASPLGILHGIGVGPGDPELITLKGWRRLQNTPIIAFPAGLGGKPGVAEQMIQPWLNPEQVQLKLHFPYVQEQQLLEQAWQWAADQVWSYLSQGQDVAFVSEGDISFYSTFSYLSLCLRQSHPQLQIESIPGICSPLAAAAAIGLPLTLGSDRLAILPALYSVAELKAVLEWADVVVLMKISSVYPQIWKILQDCGLLQQSYVVERATSTQQVIHRQLEKTPDLHLPYFSLWVIYQATTQSRNLLIPPLDKTGVCG